MQALNLLHSAFSTGFATLNKIKNNVISTTQFVTNKVAAAPFLVKNTISTISNESFSLGKKILKNQNSEIIDTDQQLLNAPSIEAYYEILVKKVVCLPLKEGDYIATSIKCNTPQYVVHSVNQDSCGLKGVF